MANDNMKHRRLQELDESDFEIVDGEPDIRGWDVKTSTGETIGEVDELILDAQEKKIRYMIVDLDHDVVKADHDGKVLIPIGLAELHEKDDDVLIPAITIEQLRQLPEYDDEHLDTETEQSIRTVLGAGGSTVQSGNDFYEHEHFDSQKLYGRRLLPERTSAENSSSGIRLNERRSITGTDASSSDRDSRDFNRSYRNEAVEEDSLLSVNNERQNPDYDTLSDNESMRDQSPVERDIERRNRTGRSESDLDSDY